jgi:hypothetical protein
VVVASVGATGFASGAEVMQGLLWNGDEFTDLRLCALGLEDVMQWREPLSEMDMVVAG